MKIAIISDAIYPYNKGGKETRLYEVSVRLAKRGHKVHIYCMKWWKGRENSRIENGVHLHAISNYYPLYSGKRRSIKQAVMFALSCFKLIKEDFEVIEADHMPHLVIFPLKLVCLLKRKKLIVIWNEVWGKRYWKEYLGHLGIIAFMIEWLSVRLADKIISVSKHTQHRLAIDLKIKNKIWPIPAGIEFRQIQKVAPSYIKSDIIFAGRLLTHKNLDILIKSITVLLKSYPRIRCLIIGEGPEKERLQNLVINLNLTDNVFFMDFLEKHDDLFSLMKSSKIFILPSTREGFGIVVLEANACGIPVIIIKEQANAAVDLIAEGQNGYTCLLNENDIAEKTLKILKNYPDIILRQNCINSIKNYDWDKVVNKTVETYLE